MTPIKLTLKGFRGIRDGLGRDELTLDLATLAGAAQLIAITGPNGSGKTTVMDNLHPYLVMPSRAGADGLGRFSYYDHVVLTENLKDLHWEHDGAAYRSEVIIRKNGKRKTEAYLYVERGGQWEPYRMFDGTPCDGKIDTYTRAIEEICGSRETFFISQFSAQGKRQLSAYEPGEIKSLLADLLGHDAIRETGVQAGKVVDGVTAGLMAIRREAATLDSDYANIEKQLLQLGDPDAEVTRLTAERVTLQAAMQSVTETRARVHAERDNAAQTDARRVQLTASRTSLITEGKEALARVDADLVREQGRIGALTQRVAERVRTQSARAEQVRRRIAQLIDVIASGARVAMAVRRLPIAQRVVSLRETGLDALRREQTAVDGLRRDVAERNKRLEGIEREAGQAALRAKELAKRFGLTKEVPCSGTEMQGSCKLLGDAIAAKPLIPTAASDIQRLSDEKRKVSDEIVVIERQIRGRLDAVGAFDPPAIGELIREQERRLDRARKRAGRLAVSAAREGEIASARTDLGEQEAEARVLSSSNVAETPEEVAERVSLEAAVTTLQAERVKLAGQFRARLDAADAELAALPPAFDPSRIGAVESAVHQATAGLEQSERAYLQAVRNQQTVSGLRVRLEELAERRALHSQRVAAIETRLSGWSLLCKSLGNDGIIALAIDDAGPTLANYTNDLLLACYGPRFTVSIHTQSTTSKGELREDFEIIVHDAESADSKPLHLTSGGERVWINECLVRAVALYLAESRQRNYDTLFSDETDGPLDPDRKRMFMAMKGEVLRLGGYRREFFVSQTPELAAMADAVIDMAALHA